MKSNKTIIKRNGHVPCITERDMKGVCNLVLHAQHQIETIIRWNWTAKGREIKKPVTNLVPRWKRTTAIERQAEKNIECPKMHGLDFRCSFRNKLDMRFVCYVEWFNVLRLDFCFWFVRSGCSFDFTNVSNIVHTYAHFGFSKFIQWEKW